MLGGESVNGEEEGVLALTEEEAHHASSRRVARRGGGGRIEGRVPENEGFAAGDVHLARGKAVTEFGGQRQGSAKANDLAG